MESNQTSKMKISAIIFNGCQLFLQKAASCMFDWVLNTPLYVHIMFEVNQKYDKNEVNPLVPSVY